MYFYTLIILYSLFVQTDSPLSTSLFTAVYIQKKLGRLRNCKIANILNTLTLNPGGPGNPVAPFIPKSPGFPGIPGDPG